LNLLSSGRSDIEVIVRDNCSTDNTIEMLHEINDSRLKIYTAPENQGTRSFFEISKLASGRIVTWLSDEDDFQFEHLDYIISKFEELACNVMFGSLVVGAGHRLIFSDEATDDPVRANFTALLFSGCGGVFIRNSCLPCANSLTVLSADDAYNLWNNYPVGFFASRCINHLLVTTCRIVAKQTRFAKTTNNWNVTSGYNSRLPHYYPETIFDRLSSNIANVCFNNLPLTIKIVLVYRLIKNFYQQTSVYKNPDFIQLLQENYELSAVKNYINHVDSLKLDKLSCRILWLLGKTIKLVFAVHSMTIHWRRKGELT